MKPLLSVLIDTYNHERYIEQAILSAIGQDFPANEYEVLVVDDGSADRTPEIVRKFTPRVRLLRKKNGGQASAFNVGIPEAQGEVIAFLDGDDWFAPGKLTAVMNALELHPEAAGVAHGCYEFHESSDELRLRAPAHVEVLELTTPEAVQRARKGLEFTLSSTLTVRRSALAPVMPISEDLAFCADNPIIVAAIAQRLLLMQEPLSYYRLHANNLCTLTTGESIAKLRRRYEVSETLFAWTGPLLTRLNVPPDLTAAFLCPGWIAFSRAYLRQGGGGRSNTFRTEMRAFRSETRNPTFAYRLFKYLFVGTATLLLPPRLFYRARDWYGEQNLGRFREQVARAGKAQSKA